MPRYKFRDLTGQVFNRLTVIERGPNQGKFVRWYCQCTCGTQTLLKSRALCHDNTQSCGCLRKERILAYNLTHGKTNTPEWQIWRGMKFRCFNSRCKAYPRYGGRGITVADRWLIFENFLTDMGPLPAPGYTIERKNNDESYSPENCIWLPREAQARNKSTNRLITLNDETKCLAEWLQSIDISRSTFERRCKQGFTDEEALTMPKKDSITRKRHKTALANYSRDTL